MWQISCCEQTFCCIVEERITAVLAMLHTPGKIAFSAFLLQLTPILQQRLACYYTLSFSIVFLLSFQSFQDVYGLCFFTGFLSKHLRCLALWLLSGREVFVTVAKPTPSVMAHQSMNTHLHTCFHRLMRRGLWLVVWILTEVFRWCRLPSPLTGEVSPSTAW